MSSLVSFTLKSSAQQTLGALAGILKKAEAHAEAAGVEESVYLNARLYPDMFPMIRQVQIASDVVKRGGERLAGLEPTSTPDEETSFAQLIKRCQSANAAVQGLNDDALDANETVTMQIPLGEQTMPMEGRLFLTNFVLPNMHFHAAMAYGLLRHQGVTLGKRDFLIPGN